MSKRRAINRQKYREALRSHKYNSTYNPGAEICADNAMDYYDIYKTKFPTHDKNSYSTPMRDYIKSTDPEID